MKKNNDIQVVAITLSDGEIITFSGKAKVYPGDTRSIVDTIFSKPKPLPDGVEWEAIEDIIGGK